MQHTLPKSVLIVHFGWYTGYLAIDMDETYEKNHQEIEEMWIRLDKINSLLLIDNKIN